MKIAVLGAGAPGLSSAVNIKKAFPSADVTIIADKFGENTTSHGAGGLFRPGELDMKGPSRNWIENGWNWYQTLASDPDNNSIGVYLTSGYQLFNEPTEIPKFVYLLPHFHELSEKELDMFRIRYRYGYYFTTVVIECKHYLPWLTQQFEDMGGKVMRRKIIGFEELASDYDILVNCLGYSNKWLSNDDKLVAVRGQMFQVEMPWLKHFVYGDYKEINFIPNQDHVAVGGVFQVGRESTEIDPEDSKTIWQRASKLVPSLQNAKVVSEWSGIRPVRKGGIRVESELKEFKNKSIHIVHNYGHGGGGITLSWGTGVHVAELVGEIVKNYNSKL